VDVGAGKAVGDMLCGESNIRCGGRGSPFLLSIVVVMKRKSMTRNDNACLMHS
jgi:hypothetical protein